MIFTSEKTTRVPVVPVHEAVFYNIRNHEDKPALVDGESDKSYSFAELARAARAFASALSRRGIKKGDVIAFYAPNGIEYCVALLGCLSVGAVTTGVNYNYTSYELKHQLSDSKSKMVVTVSSNLSKVDEVQKEYPLEAVMTLDCSVPSCLYFEDFLKDDGSAFPEDLTLNPKQDLAAIMYSSGTTGLPKGVMLTHYNLVSNTISVLMFKIFAEPVDGSQEAILGFLPLFHMFGFVILLCSLMEGMVCVTVPGFKPDTFLGAIQKHKISTLTLVPPVVLFLAKSPLVEKYDVSSVRGVLSGAAPLSDELEKAFMARFNPEYCVQGYGMTEMTAAATLARPGEQKLGGSGRLIPNTSAKIVDPSSGRSLTIGEEGEICMRGPQMMKGYLNNPEATRKTVDEDGWLHSGDLGYFDRDGTLFVTGRIKELIKHKGFQVAPAEVEGLIMTHPGVDDAAVVGIPDEATGELPKAFVVRKPQSSVTDQEISDFVKGRLSKHKWLSGGVQFVPSIPKTASGKIIRREVLKLHTPQTLSNL